MSKYPFKAWGADEWQRKLTKTLTVSRVDADIPTAKVKRQRKPWYVALTQKPDLLTEVRGVRGLPDGHTVLLSEHEVLALVRYLFEPQTAAWFEELEPTEPGTYEAVLFCQPGMVALADDGDHVRIVNGEANWSPEYFKRQEPADDDTVRRTGKFHTLPWKLERAPTRSVHINADDIAAAHQ